MSLAAIMVHVDFDEQAEARIAVAAGLARQFNALLIGVAGWPLRKLAAVQAELGFPPVEQATQETITHELDRLGEKFRRFAGPNPRGVEWRSSVHFPREVIAEQARAADLVVIGREPLAGDVYHTFDPGAVILASGRPVLVVPRALHRLQGSRVLIAWKDTREARRAVADALPFLVAAQSVVIVQIGAGGMEQRAREQIADVAAHLQRHHVAVSGQIAMAASEPEGRLLLRLAQEQGTDLIVAGAYGRSRLSEWIFGGMTRHLLTTSEIPVLFSN